MAFFHNGVLHLPADAYGVRRGTVGVAAIGGGGVLMAPPIIAARPHVVAAPIIVARPPVVAAPIARRVERSHGEDDITGGRQVAVDAYGNMRFVARNPDEAKRFEDKRERRAERDHAIYRAGVEEGRKRAEEERKRLDAVFRAGVEAEKRRAKEELKWRIKRATR